MISTLKNNALVRKVYRYLAEPGYRRHFATDGYGCFWGIFETFEEALQAAPQTKPIGYDNPDLALEYQQQVEREDGWEGSSRRASRAHAYDYPVLLWLKSIFATPLQQPTLFDFGGNVGVHYYAYQNYIAYPPDLTWEICDVPEIVRAGKELAEKRSCSNLIFTTDLSRIDGKDIFLASGSIHYLKELDLFSRSQRPPQHILLNRVPLHQHLSFVTLQNGGKVFYPHHVFHHQKFIDYFLNHGYELVDTWEDRITACMIPFDAVHSVPFFHGFYFRRSSEASQTTS